MYVEVLRGGERYGTHDRYCNFSCSVECVLYILKTLSTCCFVVEKSLRIDRLSDGICLSSEDIRYV